jgi:hypothetical protein
METKRGSKVVYKWSPANGGWSWFLTATQDGTTVAVGPCPNKSAARVAAKNALANMQRLNSIELPLGAKAYRGEREW